MIRSPIGLLTLRIAVVLTLLALLGLAGCDIQKTEPQRTGSLYVTLSSGTTEVVGARIRLDGNQTVRLTPALISGLSIGSHHVAAFRPGYVDTSLAVDVTFNATDTVALQTAPAADGAIQLVGAPDGTILIVDNMPVDTVPTASPDGPTVFSNIGVGVYQVSAYLPGHTTEAPAVWTVQVAPGSTVPISPVFVTATEGENVGDLAPDFELRSDWGTSSYRLHDFRGQVCLVTFFFYNCSACMEEFPYIASTYRDPRYSGKVQFMGVDFIDPYDRFSQYRADHEALGITFPLLHDGHQTAKTAYNVFNCPANYIIDASGRILLVQGSIPEATLRQTIDQALQTASSSTFNFTVRDTLITYNKSGQDYEFLGRTTNLLNAPRTFVYSVTPVSFPDTNRVVGICTWRTCYAMHAGQYDQPESYSPLQADTAVAFTISHLCQTDSVTQDSVPIHGNYVLNVSVHPADNTNEIISHRLYLQEEATPFAVAARPTRRISSFDHPFNR